MNELSVKEILERYNEDPELMKYILTAKSEEDKVNIKLWLSWSKGIHYFGIEKSSQRYT